MPATCRTPAFRFRLIHLTLLVGLSLPVTMVLPGCGGASDSTPVDQGGSAVPGTETNNTGRAASGAAGPGSKTTVTAAANGQKMLGDIPYDVWFDDPVGLVNNSRPIPSQPANGEPLANDTTGSGGTSETPGGDSIVVPDPPAATTDANASDWSTIISAETLQAEVKNIRNTLNQKLQTVGQYNSSLFEIPAQTATLATLAGIAGSHPGEITWKERAGHIRSIAATMHAEKLQTGPKFQRPLLEKFEQIDEMLSGSLPGGLEPPPSEFEFSDLAEMPLLMKRMEMAFNKMKTEAGSEDRFKENAEMIQHESAILGAMMKAVLSEGYGYSDEAEFLAFAKPIQDAAKRMETSVVAGSFATYDAGLSAITKSCTQCHTVYKP